MILNSIARLYRNETSGDGEPGGVSRPVNPRIAAMAQILSAPRPDAEDMQPVSDETGEIIQDAAAPAQAKVEPQADDVAPEPEPQAAAPAVAAPRMVSIVVDGQPIEVEESRLLEAGRRTLQKESAADRRLQEAQETLNRAKALERASQDPAQRSNPAPSQDAPRQTTQAAATNGLDPAALDTYLENKLYMRDANKAAEQFRKDFPEIASDPYLMNIAANEEQKRLNTAAALGEAFGDPYEAYRKHGESVRKWLQERTGTQAPVVAVDKQERKRTITAIPAVNARAPAPAAKREPTTDERIEAMRAQRAAGGRPLHRTQ